MPNVRCRYYNDDGSARNRGCFDPSTCAFVHPDSVNWNSAPPPRNDRSREPSGGRGRGRGRGRGGHTFGTDRSSSNSIPRRGGTGANSGADEGWGSKSKSEAFKGAWSDANTEDNASTNKGWGWGDADDSNKSGEDKGKGKDNESSWSGWGETSSAPSWGGGWGTEASGGVGWGTETTGGGGWGETTGGGGWGTETSGGGGWGGGWDTKASGDKKSNDDRNGGGGWGADEDNLTLPTADTSTTLNDPAWGETASSPTTKEAGGSGWKMSEWKEPSSEPTKADDSTVPTGTRRPSDADISDRPAKKLRTESLTIPPIDKASKTDVDSPNTTFVSCSAIDTKPAAPIPILGPRVKVKRQSTPVLSAPSSRGPSPERDAALTKGPPRTEKQVSYREAKILWDKYVRLINRAITLKQRSSEERRRYSDYKAAQGSSIYVKTGTNGMGLLEERARRLKELATRKEKEYRASLNELCDFEDGFDFPMKALTARSVDMKTIKMETRSMKNYLQEVKSYVETMASNVEDIESKARVALQQKAKVIPTIAPIVPEKLAESPVTRPVKDEQLESRLASLEEKVADFMLQLQEPTSGLNAKELVQEKMEEMYSAMEISLDEEEDEDILKRITKISEEHDSLGNDIENLGGDVAEIYESVNQIRNETEQAREQARAPLEEARELLAKQEAQNRDSLERLVSLEETSKSLRAEIVSVQKQKASSSHVGITSEMMDELAAVLLASIKEKVLPECQHAITIMSSSVTAVIEENTKKQIQALTAALIPVLKISGELHAKVEGKSQRGGQRSRPESPHNIDTPPKAQTSHS